MEGLYGLCDYKVANARITVSVAKRRSREKSSIRSAAPCPNIWNHLAAGWHWRKNARLTRDETHDCRWPTDAGGLWGLYSPAGYWSHCAAAMEWATLVESLVALGFLRDESKDGSSMFTLISMTDSRNLWRMSVLTRFVFFMNRRCMYIYYRHYDSSLFQIMSYIAIYLIRLSLYFNSFV